MSSKTDDLINRKSVTLGANGTIGVGTTDYSSNRTHHTVAPHCSGLASNACDYDCGKLPKSSTFPLKLMFKRMEEVVVSWVLMALQA